MRKMNFHPVIFLYQWLKIEFFLLRRVDLISISLGSYVTIWLEQMIHNLHLILRDFKWIFPLFLILDQKLPTLLLNILGRFIGCTLLHSIWNILNFVERLRCINELIVFNKKRKVWRWYKSGKSTGELAVITEENTRFILG